MKERDDSGLLVLWRIPEYDFFRRFQVFRGKRKGYLGAKDVCVVILARDANGAPLGYYTWCPDASTKA